MQIVTYLQMLNRSELRPRYDQGAPSSDCQSGSDQFAVREAVVPQWQLNRFLYQLVGGPWDWVDKLGWSDDEWRHYSKQVRTFVAYSGGNIAGYYELLWYDAEPSVEIAYFGLAPEFIGRGLGGALLTHAIEQAWSWGEPQRVWVHTCERDHPAALKNYEARGMRKYKTELETDT